MNIMWKALWKLMFIVRIFHYAIYPWMSRTKMINTVLKVL